MEGEEEGMKERHEKEGGREGLISRLRGLRVRVSCYRLVTQPQQRVKPVIPSPGNSREGGVREREGGQRWRVTGREREREV